jgi:hypothetical protein
MCRHLFNLREKFLNSGLLIFLQFWLVLYTGIEYERSHIFLTCFVLQFIQLVFDLQTLFFLAKLVTESSKRFVKVFLCLSCSTTVAIMILFVLERNTIKLKNQDDKVDKVFWWVSLSLFALAKLYFLALNIYYFRKYSETYLQV